MYFDNQIMVEYIWLDSDERRRYAKEGYTNLMELVDENNKSHIFSLECSCDECKNIKLVVEI